MPKSVPVAEVKAHLANWVRAAEAGETIVITRRGKPVAALVPAMEMDRLARLEPAGPEQGLASLAGGWEGSEQLVDRIMEVRRSRPRRAPTRR